jgi:hypothetical protein
MQRMLAIGSRSFAWPGIGTQLVGCVHPRLHVGSTQDQSIAPGVTQSKGAPQPSRFAMLY